MLRQPLEDRLVTISRASTTLTYPSSFMLVAAMNPCPCGYFSDPKHPCRCSYGHIHRYRSKISGPLLDRIDIHVEVPAVPYKDLRKEGDAESSEDIRNRATAARAIQSERFAKTKIHANAQMSSRHIKKYCKIDDDSAALLESAIDKLGLSARAYNRILKISSCRPIGRRGYRIGSYRRSHPIPNPGSGKNPSLNSTFPLSLPPDL